jgi:carbon-monoxide dehydrogenase medium subunit
MTGFDYIRPRAIGEASELLRRDDAVALAGGTDLMVAIRHMKTRPATVVDLKWVDEIGAEIETEQDGLHIGARVVMGRLIEDDLMNRLFPALVSAASVVGSVQIRNRATLAGNLCNASPAADTATALLAYSASVAVSGPEGDRVIPLNDFFLGPGSTMLGRGDVVTAVHIPLLEERTGSAFARVTRRRGVDLASVSVACVVEPSGAARFGFGAVGPRPLLAESTVDELADETGWERLLAVASPISDVRAGAEYRRAMLQIHARRALLSAIEQLEAA